MTDTAEAVAQQVRLGAYPEGKVSADTWAFTHDAPDFKPGDVVTGFTGANQGKLLIQLDPETA